MIITIFSNIMIFFSFVRPGKKIGLLHVVFGLEDRGAVQLKFSPRRHVSEQVGIQEIKATVKFRTWEIDSNYEIYKKFTVTSNFNVECYGDN